MDVRPQWQRSHPHRGGGHDHPSQRELELLDNRVLAAYRRTGRTHNDFNNNTTSYAYYTTSSGSGAVGDLQSITLPGSPAGPQPAGSYSFTYTGFGVVKTVTDPIGGVVTYNYDRRQPADNTSYSDGSSEQVAYSTSSGSSAMVLSTSDRNTNKTEYNYYSNGLLQSVLVHQGTTATVLSTTTKTYGATTLMLTRRLRMEFGLISLTITLTVWPPPPPIPAAARWPLPPPTSTTSTGS